MTPETREKVGGYSNMVVGATIGVALIYFIWTVLGWQLAVLATLYLIYEGWTLINRYREDTLSESVWRLSARPMVPWLFGTANGAWLMHLYYQASAGQFDPKMIFVVAGMLFLQGHFFFQAYKENKKLIVEDAVTKAEGQL